MLRSDLDHRATAVLRTSGASEPAPVKTAEGQAEMSRRHRGLSQRQRTMLLLVDGRRSVSQVKQVAVQAGAADTCFDELIELGLIAVPKPAPIAPDPMTVAAAPASSTPLPTEPATFAPPVPDHSMSLESEMDTVLPETAVPSSLPSLPSQLQALAPIPEDSVTSSWLASLESAFGDDSRSTDGAERDQALDEARRMLMRAVRSKSPVTGAMTLIRLRRARTREELFALFDEVDAHISTPMRNLSGQQTLRHVRTLLERPM